jgi:hypothetical protein
MWSAALIPGLKKETVRLYKLGDRSIPQVAKDHQDPSDQQIVADDSRPPGPALTVMLRASLYSP